MYENILSPINYGGLELKNRIIFAPTTMGLKDKDYLRKIEELAKGGVAMIIIGDVPAGNSKFCKSIRTRGGYKFYSECVKIAHMYDTKIIAQLHEDDSDILGMMKAMPKLIFKHASAEDIRKKLNELTSKYITNMDLAKINSIIESFASAALICQKCGFDGIQIHGDRMCGSFTSPLINKRKDIFGGSLEGRMKFALDTVSAVREVLPKMPIDFKLAVRIESPHYGNAGILFDEIKYFVPELENRGVTSFHVALANHSSLSDTIPPKNHPYFKDEGCFLGFCDEVRKYTSLPICGVGALSHPDFIEANLKNGRIDCASMCRELICEPNYVNKLIKEKPNEIKYCIRCNKGCLDGVFKHKGIHCIFDGK